MISLGDTFHWQAGMSACSHLYIVIAEDASDGQVLVVNVTTKTNTSDLSCILSPTDHTFIIRPSIISYVDARELDKNKLETWINNINDIDFKPDIPVSQNVLDRIIKGAETTDALKRGFQEKYL